HTPDFNNYAFKRLTVKDGLSSNQVTAIFKDSQGYMWIGTQNGLSKYDGVAFENFKSEIRNNQSISDNNITAIAEDKKGGIWIATMNGLNRFNPKKKIFTRFVNSKKKGSLSNNKVLSLLIDVSGSIWIGTDNGLNLFQEKSQNFQSFLPNPKNPHALFGKAILDMAEEDANTIWLGTWGGGLNRLDKKTKKFTSYTQPQSKNENNPNLIWCLDINKGSIWFGAFYGDFYKFDIKTKKFAFIVNKIDDKKIYVSSSIKKISEDVLLVGTESAIYSINFRTNDTTKLEGVQNHLYSRHLIDNENNFWFCTSEGLVKYDVNQYKFSKAELKITTSITNVLDITYRNNSIIFANDNGAYQYFLKERQIKPLFKFESFDAKAEKIYIDSSDMLWVLTSDGPYKYNFQTRQARKYVHDTFLGGEFSEQYYTDVAEVAPGELWFSTDAGIKIFNSKTEKFTHKYHIQNSAGSLKTNHLTSILKDSKNNIWVGSNGEGVNKCSVSNQAFIEFKNTPEHPWVLSSNTINRIFEDSRGNVWFCTSNGL
ncbi:MAG: hypothetical protein H7X88_06705, partial [Gloeobacteraceae cyanobacterium ES-bin-316]|nr:hypothetical protein [Ferruginibacter sp.]